jgi:hypothetical protein
MGRGKEKELRALMVKRNRGVNPYDESLYDGEKIRIES